MKKILFVCTGNTCRSPMAEAILREHSAKSGMRERIIEVASAGLYADEGAPISPLAIDALKEMGIEPHAHTARQITDQMAREADLILTMSASHLMQICRFLPQHAQKAHTLKAYAMDSGDCVRCIDNDIADPYGGTIVEYRACAKEIAECVTRVLEKL